MTDYQTQTAAWMLATLEQVHEPYTLVPAPRPTHSGHMIRVSNNPDWYQDLYADTPNIRRDRTLKSLARLAGGRCEYPLDELLLDTIDTLLDGWGVTE